MSIGVTISKEEEDEFRRCESEISKEVGNLQAAYLQVGKALCLIQEKRLYRAESLTFEAYVVDRWDLTRGRAYQLISAHKVVSSLPKNVNTLLTNEAQVRVIAPVPQEDRVEVIELAQKNYSPQRRMTAPGLRKARHDKYPDGVPGLCKQAHPKSRVVVKPPSPASVKSAWAKWSDKDKKEILAWFTKTAEFRALNTSQQSKTA